jgi:periplasmic protein TonB
MTGPPGEQNRTPDGSRELPGEPLVVPIVHEPASRVPRRNGFVRGVAWVLAATAHAALLYSLVREPGDPKLGSGGQHLGAVVSVALVSSPVLESREPDRSESQAPAAVVPVEANDGAQDQPAAPALEQPEDKQERVEKQELPEETVRPVDSLMEVAPKPTYERKPEESATPHGGAAARGEADSATGASGQTAASAGAAQEYARQLSAALSKAKPAGTGVRGTVRIKFVLSPQGLLASAEVLESSGNTRLDFLALEAVRRAIFPVPPPAMTLTELTYDVTYGFDERAR